MLKTSFIVSKEECSKFLFTETTGDYSNSNTSGWGTPNYELNEVQDSYVTIQNYLTLEKYEQVEITSSAEDTTEITYSDLILEGTTTSINVNQIKDGIYHFNYFILFDNNDTKSSSFYLLSLCTLECQLKALTSAFINQDTKCCKDKDLLSLYLEAMALYKALIFSYQCADFVAFNKVYKNLEKLLKHFKCAKC